MKPRLIRLFICQIICGYFVLKQVVGPRLVSDAVYSEKGAGTTFNIYLPVSEKEFIQEEEFAEELSKGSETVLLVDDEVMIIDVAGQLLEKLGYKVYTAASGKEAIDIYKKQKDDIGIVILDVIMPGMDGGETYDRLKAINLDYMLLQIPWFPTYIKNDCDQYKRYNYTQLCWGMI